jgi:hypothetical protein
VIETIVWFLAAVVLGAIALMFLIIVALFAYVAWCGITGRPNPLNNPIKESFDTDPEDKK